MTNTTAIMTILIVVTVAASEWVQGQSSIVHTDVYPPHDEYTFTNFNPENLYGAPYGGFARATESRLAKLSLQLSDTHGFDFLTSSSDAGTQTSSSSSSTSLAPHWTMRDGDGRLFACRAYKEEELAPSSIKASMFDDAVLRGEDQEVEKVTSPAKTKTSSSRLEQNKKARRKLENFMNNVQSSMNQMNVLYNNILSKMSFSCVYLNLGWWSYEWCDMKTVKQYHIEETTASSTSKKGATTRSSQVTDQVLLGKFKNKAVFAKDTTTSTSNNNNGNHQALAAADVIILHQFEGGDLCPETGRQRRVTVEVRCCSENDHARSAKKKKQSSHSSDKQVHFLHVAEQNICTYTATACSDLLCPEQIVREMGNLEGYDDEDNEVNKEDHDEDNVENEYVSGDGEGSSDANDESISSILDRTLSETCLTKTAGWWHYEFCHKKHIREFHPKQVFDQVLGNHYYEEEDEHYLGKYDVSNDFPPQEEQVRFSPDDAITTSATTTYTPFQGTTTTHTYDTSSATGDTTTPYFVQTYSHGNVCADEDVTETSIKGGNVLVDGEVERATVVRFSCGKRAEIVRVNEDSTCHYVFDVTVPELCRHVLFKRKTETVQVVKCLPVETEWDVEESE